MITGHPHWQALEIHENTRDRILKQTGRVDEKGRLLRYNGKAFWEAFSQAGHSSAEFAQCKCNPSCQTRF